MLISGSDDTTVKFWDLARHTLMGTFRAATTTVDPAKPTAVRDLDWVLYTPDGHFDASQTGRELVRFRQEDRAHHMEQFDSTKLYTFELSDLLRSGRIAEPAHLDPPAPVAIDPPPESRPHATRNAAEHLLRFARSQGYPAVSQWNTDTERDGRH